MMSEWIEFNVKVFTKQIFRFINVALVCLREYIFKQFVFSFQFSSEFQQILGVGGWKRMKLS